MKYLSGVASLVADADKCTGCGACPTVCPHGVLEVRDRKVRIIDIDLCMECGACMNNCAFDAISVDKGVGCAAAIINSLIYGGEPSCDCSGGASKGDSCC